MPYCPESSTARCADNYPSFARSPDACAPPLPRRYTQMNIKTSRRNWLDSLAFAVAILPFALPAFAQDASLTTELADIQQSWDHANYQSANAEDKQRQL